MRASWWLVCAVCDTRKFCDAVGQDIGWLLQLATCTDVSFTMSLLVLHHEGKNWFSPAEAVAITTTG